MEIFAQGVESEDGQITMNGERGRSVRILKNVNPIAFYERFAVQLGEKKQSAVIGSFSEQKRLWSTPNKSRNGP